MLNAKRKLFVVVCLAKIAVVTLKHKKNYKLKTIAVSYWIIMEPDISGKKKRWNDDSWSKFGHWLSHET